MRGWGRFFSRKQNYLGLGLVGAFIFASLAAPLLAPLPEVEMTSPYRSVDKLKGMVPFPPGPQAILGTVATGVRGSQVDVFFTVVWGSRSALSFGLTVTLLTAALGVLVGAASGFIGGWFNDLVMRITDAFIAFPIIAGVVVLDSLLHVNERLNLFIMLEGGYDYVAPSRLDLLLQRIDAVSLTLILFSWMPYARLVNTMVLRIRQADFILAAQAMGAGMGRIILRHALPNSISPAVVLAARDIGGMVLTQATLTFVGMGGDSEWGGLLALGRRWIIGPGGSPLTYWWVFVPITLALVLFGIGWNMLGDGLNDWLNPRQA